MDVKTKQSPQIVHLSWGRIQIEGVGDFKDAKVYPGGARAWDWRETGTQHVPGIQPADVEELLLHGARVVVLSTGVQEQLQVCVETEQWLRAQGVVYYIRQTEEAVRLFNHLRQSELVGGLFHSTC